MRFVKIVTTFVTDHVVQAVAITDQAIDLRGHLWVGQQRYKWFSIFLWPSFVKLSCVSTNSNAYNQETG